MFLENKYTKWYYSIICNAKSRDLVGYVEKHHIVPASLGGSNSKDNLVRLTAKEHFLCHMLLVKMVESSQKSSMIFAAWRMTHSNNHQPRYTINSNTYSKLKALMSKAASLRSSNYWKNPENRKKQSEKSKKTWADPNMRKQLSESQTKRWSDPVTRQHQSDIQKYLAEIRPDIGKKKARPGKLNGMYGKTHSDEIKQLAGQRAIENFKGKTYEEIHGPERALELKKDRSVKLKEYLKNNIGIRKGTKNSNSKTYEFIDPSGVTYIVNGSLKLFCKNHKLQAGSVIDVAKNRTPEYKGWKVRYL